MATIRFFHEIHGNVHELPDRGAFPYERELQEFFEKHLCTLIGVEFLASEYSTGERHSRRVELLRYRRYGDAYVAVEWVYGGETIDPAPEPAGPPRGTVSEERGSVAPHRSRSSAPGAGEDPDYSAD